MPTLPATKLAVAARIALAAYVLGIAWITLAPAKDAVQVTGIVGQTAALIASTGLVSNATSYSVLEFLANIVLFVPFGLLLRLAFARLRWWQIIAIGCATSLSIELAQLGLPSRFSTVSDLVANTLGTALLSRTRTPVVAGSPMIQGADHASERA